jgi:hypothetical protein
MSEAQSMQRELLRQQQLLRTLWRRGDDASLRGWLQEAGVRAEHGLAAYRGNAGALAERALAAAFPTVQQVIGGEGFVQLARAFWHRHPPRCGDLARYGDALPEWIAADAQLASEAYLADVARIDWAVHAIEHAADLSSPPLGLALLGQLDPSQLALRLRQGLACVVSRWPVVTIWQAHRSAEADRFAPVREAFARRVAQTALVARTHWRAVVSAIDEPSAHFVAALQRGDSLGHALDAAGDSFRFEPWLHEAVRQQWLQAVEPVADATSGGLR